VTRRQAATLQTLAENTRGFEAAGFVASAAACAQLAARIHARLDNPPAPVVQDQLSIVNLGQGGRSEKGASA
jgi:broad specificity phosphatase PhoE